MILFRKVSANTEVLNELRNDFNVKYILPTLLRFASRILSRDIDDLKKAAKEYGKVLYMSDVKKIMGRNTKPDSNGGKVKGFLRDLEYIVFGAHEKFLKEFN